MLKVILIHQKPILVFDLHQKLKINTEPSNDQSYNITIQYVQQFLRRISFLNLSQSEIILALTAMVNSQLEQKNHKCCRGPSNEYSYQVWFQLAPVILEKTEMYKFKDDNNRLQC